MESIRQLVDRLATPGKKDGGRLLRALKTAAIPVITGKLELDAHLAYHDISYVICPTCAKHFIPNRAPKFVWAPLNYGCSKACTTKYRHGFISPFEKLSTQQAKTATVRKKYGVENVFQAKAVKLSIKESLLANLGVSSAMKSPSVVAKARKTYRERYGGDWVFSRESSIRRDIELAWKARWGALPQAHQDVIQRANETRFTRYGHSNPCGTLEAKEKALHTKRQRAMLALNETLDVQQYAVLKLDEQELLNKGRASALLLHNCGATELLPITASGRVLKQCASCRPISKPEQEVYDWLSSLTPVERHNRNLIKPKELDMVSHKHRIAIELNGVYWHRDEIGVGTTERHQAKTDACEDLGYQLIQVFDHEWHTKRELVQSVLQARLGLAKRIGARKLQLKDVSRAEAMSFLNENHLQGHIDASTTLGLYQAEELLMLLSIGGKRFSKNNELEIYRQATKKGYAIIGGLNKLLKEVKRRFPNRKLVTFVDRRFFTGESYLKNGFKLIAKTAPNYWYYKRGKLLNRLQAKRSSLPDLLGDDYNELLTEQENMELSGWYKLSDSGNLKLELDLRH